MRKVSWKALCLEADSRLYSSRVNVYEFSNGRVFSEPADASYPDTDLLPSNLIVPDDDLFPEGDD